MLLAILIIVCAAFVIQCCVFNKAVSERRFRSAEDILTTIAEDLSGSTRNSAEYYNAVKQIHTDIKRSSDDFSADTRRFSEELDKFVQSVVCNWVDSSDTEDVMRVANGFRKTMMDVFKP